MPPQAPTALDCVGEQKRPRLERFFRRINSCCLAIEDTKPNYSIEK